MANLLIFWHKSKKLCFKASRPRKEDRMWQRPPISRSDLPYLSSFCPSPHSETLPPLPIPITTVQSTHLCQQPYFWNHHQQDDAAVFPMHCLYVCHSILVSTYISNCKVGSGKHLYILIILQKTFHFLIYYILKS